jgi:hypothetical protein
MRLGLTASARNNIFRPFALIAAGAILLATLIVVLDGRVDRSTTVGEAVASDSAAASASAVDAIKTFAFFTTQHRAEHEAGLDHAYTAKGLRLLAVAVANLVHREAAFVRHERVGAELLEQADILQIDGLATTHSDIARSAFASATEAIAEVQRVRYPELAGAIRDLRDAVQAIRPDQLLLDQRSSIQNFFDRASDVLRGMAEVGF